MARKTSQFPDPKRGFRPVLVALAVAVFGLLAMLIVVRPWSRPDPQSPAQVVNSSGTTAAAAEAAGATVTPTEPKLAIEPTPPGPKPIQPAQPAPSGN